MALVLTVPALLLGGQHAWVLVLAALLAGAAAWLLSHRVEQMPKAAWLVLGLVAFTALQLVPLPIGLVRLLSAPAAEVWSGALRPFGEPAPSWATLSVDPGATALELLKGSIYACIAIAAAGLVAARGASYLSAALFGASLLVALVTIAHAAVGAERVYGLYPPPSGEHWTVGPFINGNNLAGFLNLGLFAAAGLWLSESERIPRWVPALGIPILAVSVVLSGSRGGVGALVFGAIVFVAFAVRRRDPRTTYVLFGGAGLIGVGAVIAVFAAGGARLREQLTDTDYVGKSTLWRWAGRMIADFPVFGVGRGAFETAFPPYRQPSEHEWASVFSHAENFVVDWAAEWGVPVTIVALLAALRMTRPALRRLRRDSRMLGLWVGLGALLVQSLVDLGLEIFAIAAAAVAVFATAQEQDAAVTPSRPWLLRAPVAASAVSALIVLLLGTELAQVERRRLARAFADVGKADHGQLERLRAELRSATLRHPGDAYFPLLGSFLARRQGKDPLPWLGRALERGPRSGNVHLALADVLAERGKTPQALMHLRFAARYDFNSRGKALAKAGQWARSPEELIAAFPLGSEGGSLLRDACGELAAAGQFACLREVLSRDPSDLGTRNGLVERLLDARESDAPPCDFGSARACEEEVGRLLAPSPDSTGDWRAASARGRLQALRGDVRGAAKSLLEHCPATPEAQPCIVRALEFAEKSGDLPLLEMAGERYLALACVATPRCADAQFRIARSFATRRAWGSALRHYNLGVEADPTPRRWLDLADAATQAGSNSTARVAIRRASSAGELSDDDRRRKGEIEGKLDEPARLE